MPLSRFEQREGEVVGSVAIGGGKFGRSPHVPQGPLVVTSLLEERSEIFMGLSIVWAVLHPSLPVLRRDEAAARDGHSLCHPDDQSFIRSRVPHIAFRFSEQEVRMYGCRVQPLPS